MNSLGVISMVYARPFTAEHLPLLGRIRAAGLDFVELLVPEPGELELAETRAALDDSGLGVVLAARVNLARDLASTDAASFRAGVDYLRTCVHVARALGAAIVGGPLYGAPLVFAGRAPAPVPEVERRRRVDQVTAGLKETAAYADAEGVTLAVEPLNRFETDFANTIDQGLDILNRVDSPGLGLLLDTFHMNMEESDLAAAALRAGSHIAYVQANENHRGFVGTGHVDWPAFVEALVQTGYRGPIGLEPFRRNDGRLGVPLAQWRPPTENEDGPLAESAAYLRRLIAARREAA